jgi:lipopolysaccharide export system permease protein
MKKIDLLLLKSFIGPFVVSFGIALFTLIMQFLWLYIDDIAGKGVSIFILLELIGYLSISTFPMALPIGVLIASVMVLGNMAERYELSSFKSAGVSLMRVLRPLMFICAGVALFSYVCSDFIIPVANLKFRSRLFDIRKQKPALSIEKGVFNEDFRQFVIRVGDKKSDGETIEQVLIEDQSNSGRTRFNQIIADSGQMYTTTDQRFFVMNLYRGNQYQDPGPSTSSTQQQKFPFIRTKFDSWTKVWDMREFDMNRTDEDRFSKQRSMLSMSQLRTTVDSLYMSMDKGKQSIADDLLMNLKRPLEKPQLAVPANTTVTPTQPANNATSNNSRPINRTNVAANVDPITGIAASGTQQPIRQPQPAKKPVTPPSPPTNLPKPGIQVKSKGRQLQTSAGVTSVQQSGDKPLPALPANVTQAAAAPITTPAPAQYVVSKNPAIPRQIMDKPIEQYGSLLETFDPAKRVALREDAIRQVRLVQTNIESRRVQLSQWSIEAVKSSYELYIKYSFALVCLVFLFIGGPMGAIIRKGGFGYPILISIIFFVAFIFLTILCRKLAESYVLIPMWAALMPCLVLIPLAAFLTVRANRDSAVFSTDRLDRALLLLRQRMERTKKS